MLKGLLSSRGGDALPMISRDDFFTKLTRQREVLNLLARRLSNNEVARLLQLAEATMKIDMAALRMRLRHSPRPPCPPSPTNEQGDPPASP